MTAGAFTPAEIQAACELLEAEAAALEGLSAENAGEPIGEPELLRGLASFLNGGAPAAARQWAALEQLAGDEAAALEGLSAESGGEQIGGPGLMDAIARKAGRLSGQA